MRNIARLTEITPEQEQMLTTGMGCLLPALEAYKLAHRPLAKALRALEAERDAIRAKTIEECAHLADVMSGDVDVTGESAAAVVTAYAIGKAIRDLAKK